MHFRCPSTLLSEFVGRLRRCVFINYVGFVFRPDFVRRCRRCWSYLCLLQDTSSNVPSRCGGKINLFDSIRRCTKIQNHQTHIQEELSFILHHYLAQPYSWVFRVEYLARTKYSLMNFSAQFRSGLGLGSVRRSKITSINQIALICVDSTPHSSHELCAGTTSIREVKPTTTKTNQFDVRRFTEPNIETPTKFLIKLNEKSKMTEMRATGAALVMRYSSEKLCL